MASGHLCLKVVFRKNRKKKIMEQWHKLENAIKPSLSELADGISNFQGTV